MANRVVLSVPRGRAAVVVNGLIAKGDEIHAEAESVRDDESFSTWAKEATRWRRYVKSALQSICVDDALAEEFEDATRYGYGVMSMGEPSLGERLHDRLRDHDREVETVRSIAERLSLFEAPEGEGEKATDEPPAESAPTSRVFVVHGRQRDSADVVARFVERLGLEPIILDEQANEGRTILEKLEANTEDVGFAVVLLQPDDFGRGPDDDDWPAEPTRARQNVVLELGFFVGKIGRARVAALVATGVEQPSDILGLAYIPFDESWQLRLARELKHAYPELDLNRVA